MKRRLAVLGAMVCSVALLGVASAPASAASPPGQGLRDFGTFTCEGIGDVSIIGPRPGDATAGFTPAGETLITVSISGTATVDGETFSFSKSYGVKAGLESFTCTQHFEEDANTTDLTLVVALVPPH
jgi:hypothetical protein